MNIISAADEILFWEIIWWLTDGDRSKIDQIIRKQKQILICVYYTGNWHKFIVEVKKLFHTKYSLKKHFMQTLLKSNEFWIIRPHIYSI